MITNEIVSTTATIEEHHTVTTTETETIEIEIETEGASIKEGEFYIDKILDMFSYLDILQLQISAAAANGIPEPLHIS